MSGEWRIFQQRRGHRWSLDDLTTAWVAARHADRLDVTRSLDLGCGLGSVLMMLAWKRPAQEVIGVEAQADRAALARRSLAYNGADARCRVISGDLRDATFDAPFSLITGTPPYFPIGTGTEAAVDGVAPCRFEHRGGIEAYTEAASRWLTPAGAFVVCTASLERDRVEATARLHGLTIIEHLEIIPKIGKPALVCVDVLSREGTRRDDSLTVRDEAGRWTDAFRRVREDMGLPPRAPNE